MPLYYPSKTKDLSLAKNTFYVTSVKLMLITNPQSRNPKEKLKELENTSKMNPKL